MVMLGVFDTVDDTVLVKKTLLSVGLMHLRALSVLSNLGNCWGGTTLEANLVPTFQHYFLSIYLKCAFSFAFHISMPMPLLFYLLPPLPLFTCSLPSPQELVPCLEELCDHRYGCRVILYLLSPRNKQHFSSQFVQNVLACGDGNKHTLALHVLLGHRVG